VPELQRLPHGQFHHLLGPSGERDPARDRLVDGSRRQRRDQCVASRVQGHAERFDALGGQAFRLVQQAQGEVLGDDDMVPALAGLLGRRADRVLGPRGEPGERMRVKGLGQGGPPAGLVLGYRQLGSLRHEALLRRLLGHAHGLADLRPGSARLASLIHEVPDQVVGQLIEVLGDPHGRRHVIKRRPVLALDVADEVVEPNRQFIHSSTIG
jgi:hypothetical protein